MARFLTFPAGKRAKFVVAIVFFLVTAVVGGLFSGKFEDAQENETVSFLPGKAESVKSLEAVKRYPGGELAPAVIVYERKGGLTAADRQPRGRGPARRSPTTGPRSPCPRRSRCSRRTATPRCSRSRSARPGDSDQLRVGDGRRSAAA